MDFGQSQGNVVSPVSCLFGKVCWATAGALMVKNESDIDLFFKLSATKPISVDLKC